MSDKSGGESESVGFLPSLDINVTFLDVQDVENMCRLCMATKENSSSLCMVGITSSYPNSSTPISQLFLDALNIDINDASSQGMPNTVCVECLAKLHYYNNFKRHALTVDAKLREIVGKKRKIAEAQALYGPVFFDLESSNQYSDNSPTPSLYFEPNNEAEQDVCLSEMQGGDNEVEPLHILEIPHSETLSLPEISELEDPVGEENSVGFSRNCKVIVLRREENVSEKLSFNQDGQSNFSQEVEGNIMVSEVRTGIANGVVSSNNKKSELLNSGIEQIQNQEGEACTDAVGGMVITQLECATAELQRCSPEIISPESSTAQQDLIQQEGNMSCTDQRDVPIQSEVKIILCNKETRPSQKCKKKRRGKKYSVPIPEVLVVENAHSEKRLVYRCTLCRNVSDSRILFRKHVISHFKDRGVVCKHCEKWFKNQSSLVRHERTHSGEKPFLCLLCDRSFSQKEILQRHILTHTDTKPFQCQRCDKSYTQKEGLTNHMKHYHVARKEIMQYPCPLCDKAFCHPSGLSRHMIAHTGKQYKCNICCRKFTDISSLRRHSRSQHPEESTT